MSRAKKKATIPFLDVKAMRKKAFLAENISSAMSALIQVQPELSEKEVAKRSKKYVSSLFEVLEEGTEV